MKRVCSKCGKELDTFDELTGFHYHMCIGYGSKFDGEQIDIDLCCDCTDEIIDSCMKEEKNKIDNLCPVREIE